MAMTIATLAVAREGLWDALTLAAKDFDGEYARVCRMASTRQEFERVKSVSGIGVAGRTNEGQAVNRYSRREGNTKDYYPVKYTAYIPYSWEAEHTDLYGKFRENGELIALALEARRQQNFADVFFNNGFDSVNNPGPDGVSLYSTAHPFPGGVTGSNRPASNLALNTANLAQCAREVIGVKDAMGIYHATAAKTYRLVTGLSLMWTARNVLASPFTRESADYDPAKQKEMFSPLLVKEIESSTAWFVVASDPKWHSWTMLNRIPRRKHSFIEDNTHVTVDGAYEEHVFLWKDWRGCWGTPGS